MCYWNKIKHKSKTWVYLPTQTRCGILMYKYRKESGPNKVKWTKLLVLSRLSHRGAARVLMGAVRWRDVSWCDVPVAVSGALSHRRRGSRETARGVRRRNHCSGGRQRPGREGTRGKPARSEKFGRDVALSEWWWRQWSQRWASCWRNKMQRKVSVSDAMKKIILKLNLKAILEEQWCLMDIIKQFWEERWGLKG